MLQKALQKCTGKSCSLQGLKSNGTDHAAIRVIRKNLLKFDILGRQQGTIPQAVPFDLPLVQLCVRFKTEANPLSPIDAETITSLTTTLPSCETMANPIS